jgi:hypothetical protein
MGRTDGAADARDKPEIKARCAGQKLRASVLGSHSGSNSGRAKRDGTAEVTSPKEAAESAWSVKERFEELSTQFGLPAAVLIVLALAGLWLYWNWDEVAKRPGIDPVLARFRRRTLPSAPADLITIAVAHLDKDKGEHERLLLGELRTVQSAEVQRVDRTIEWPAAATESVAKIQADKEARDLLERIGADVLIWGYVQRISKRSAMQLDRNYRASLGVLGRLDANSGAARRVSDRGTDGSAERAIRG